MLPSPTRVAIAAIGLLAATGVGAPGPHPGFIASFIYSCDASNPEPRVRTTYTAPGKPRSRPASAPVEVFQRGQAVARKHVELGTVSVLASGSRTSVSELTTWAQRGARRLGGDALVDVHWDDAASAKPPAGPVGLLYLTATVVRWE